MSAPKNKRYSVKEAALRMGKSEKRLRNLMSGAHRKITSRRDSEGVYLLEADIQAYEETQEKIRSAEVHVYKTAS